MRRRRTRTGTRARRRTRGGGMEKPDLHQEKVSLFERRGYVKRFQENAGGVRREAETWTLSPRSFQAGFRPLKGRERSPTKRIAF